MNVGVEEEEWRGQWVEEDVRLRQASTAHVHQSLDITALHVCGCIIVIILQSIDYGQLEWTENKRISLSTLLTIRVSQTLYNFVCFISPAFHASSLRSCQSTIAS